jgi:hypothetical protein
MMRRTAGEMGVGHDSVGFPGSESEACSPNHPTTATYRKHGELRSLRRTTHSSPPNHNNVALPVNMNPHHLPDHPCHPHRAPVQFRWVGSGLARKARASCQPADNTHPHHPHPHPTPVHPPFPIDRLRFPPGGQGGFWLALPPVHVSRWHAMLKRVSVLRRRKKATSLAKLVDSWYTLVGNTSMSALPVVDLLPSSFLAPRIPCHQPIFILLLLRRLFSSFPVSSSPGGWMGKSVSRHYNLVCTLISIHPVFEWVQIPRIVTARENRSLDQE